MDSEGPLIKEERDAAQAFENMERPRMDANSLQPLCNSNFRRNEKLWRRHPMTAGLRSQLFPHYTYHTT